MTEYTLDNLPAGAFDMSPENAHALLEANSGICLVDVREPDEFLQGYIRGAMLLPLGEILQGSTEGLPEERDTPLFVYCRSGKRSATAAEVLAAQGYRHVANIGGVLDWPFGLVK